MEIGYLADHLDAIPLLAEHCHREWSYLVPGRTLQDVAESMHERAVRNRMPLALVAYDGTEILGTVYLTLHDMDTRTDLNPWLAGLYVIQARRNQGVGSRLVTALEDKARELKLAKLYLYTPSAQVFYAKLGWEIREEADYHGYLVTIMEKML